MELNTNRTDRGNPVCRELFGEYLGGRFLQWVRIMLTARRGIRYLRTADDHHEEFVVRRDESSITIELA